MTVTLTNRLAQSPVLMHRPGRILLLLHLLDALGKGVFLSVGVVYFTQVVNLSAAQIGLGTSLAGLGGLLATLTLGVAADRLGPRLILFLMLLLQAVGFLLYPAVQGPLFYYAVAFAIGTADYGGGPAFGSIIGAMYPTDQRVRVRAVLRTAFNVGFCLGSATSAVAIAAGGRWLQGLPLLTALLMLVSASLVPLLPRVARVPKDKSRLLSAISDRKFMTVVALNFPLALHSTVLLVALPLYIIDRTELPKAVVPPILIVNTALVILLQVRASRGADTTSSASRVARESGFWLAAACACVVPMAMLPRTLALVDLVLVVLLITMAELRQATAAWGLAHGLAPDHARAQYIGTFNLYSVAQSIVGPVILVAAVGDFGTTAWLLTALFIVASGLLMPRAVAAMRSSPIAMKD